jgi:hypothetical protein
VARLLTLGLLVPATAAALPWDSSAADNGSGSYPASLVAESWYRAGADTLPRLGCGIPAVGCAPIVSDASVPNQYPAQTLHVGVTGGAEDSRTYLTLANSSVPVGTDVTGGTLTLPVATDTEAGTTASETASLRACQVKAQVKNGVEGGIGGAPAVDCSVTSRAVFTAAKGSVGPFFTIDLSPFAKDLNLGQASIALVPGDEPGTAWHVAMSRSDRNVSGARRITAMLRTGVDVQQPATTPVDEVSDAGPPAAGFTSGQLVTPGLESAPVPVPPQVTQPVTAPAGGAAPVRLAPVAARTISRSVLSPVTLLLPLLLLVGAAWVSRTFTRELLQVRG